MSSINKVIVKGSSMNPILLNNDFVIIKKESNYSIGDIIVFKYKNVLLIHRLLKICESNYYCKGDNSYNLEKIEKKEVIGKVIFILRMKRLVKPANVSEEFIKSSLKINRLFVLNNFNISNVKKTKIYQDFKKRYLDGEVL